MAANQLPHQPTSFIGREAEIAQIIARLNAPSCRLLTLVGMGGSGKTRLAIEAAERLNETFPDGVWFVPLQPLQYSTQVVAAILDALPIQVSSEPHTQLLHYLRDKQLLLILDNFEQLLESVDLVSEIIGSTPHIKILVTSREVLNLQEEWVQSIEGMMYSDVQSARPVEQYDALRLFGERASQVLHTFALHQELESVLRICRLVNGLPLALELAAGWTKALSCKAIAEELQHNSSILTSHRRNIPKRHSSIRFVLEHSWLLLDGGERLAFRRLSVFRGGFTREAAEQIAGASLPVLAHLVDQSLINRNADGRYTMHELLRQYADEQLEAAGESERIYDAHSVYFADFLDQRVKDVKGRRQVAALAEIKFDFENVRTAWNWAVAHRHTYRINRMMEGLWLFCTLCNRKVECAALFQEAAQQFGDEPRLYGRLLARIAHGTVDSQSQLETALQIAHEFDDLAEAAFCLEWLGYSAGLAGDYDKSKQLLEQSLATYRRLGDRYYLADVLFKLMTFDLEGSWDSYKNFGEESLRLRREIGDRIGTAWSIAPVAHSHVRVGQFAEAERLWQERVTIGYEVDALELVAMGHAHLSYQIYFFQGDFDKARAAAEEAIKITSRVSAFHHITADAWSLVTLGLLANMDENYHEGRTLCQQAVYRTGYRNVHDFAAWGLAISVCGLEDFETAAQLLPTALKHCTKLYGVVGIILCLPIAALILTNQSQKVRAVEFLALAFTHPVRASGWMEKWPLLGRIRAELEQGLGSEAYSAAWERGKRLDVLTVAAELQVRFEAGLQPGASSADALTEREQDVLRLLAQGHSNREIAEALVLAVGTVKGYVYNICQKLGAQNRTQAVICARQQGLLP